MRKILRKKIVLIALPAMISIASINAVEKETTIISEFQLVVVEQFIEKAKTNTNWKNAFATGKNEQIVFMNISSVTNPNNEIGVEVHTFDQVILIVHGNGKAVLNGKTTLVKEGDMIFIPQGISHNVINSAQDKELKLISFYSDTDIPKDAVYAKKADEPKVDASKKMNDAIKKLTP